jgi:hypothetical protein
MFPCHQKKVGFCVLKPLKSSAFCEHNRLDIHRSPFNPDKRKPQKIQNANHTEDLVSIL